MVTRKTQLRASWHLKKLARETSLKTWLKQLLCAFAKILAKLWVLRMNVSIKHVSSKQLVWGCFINEAVARLRPLINWCLQWKFYDRGKSKKIHWKTQQKVKQQKLQRWHHNISHSPDSTCAFDITNTNFLSQVNSTKSCSSKDTLYCRSIAI